MQETTASIRNLEVQMGQMSKQLPERSSNTFPGDTVVNPREDCKAIQLRSGKVAGCETKVMKIQLKEKLERRRRKR